MKTIKNVKLKTAKTATKVSAVKSPAVIAPSNGGLKAKTATTAAAAPAAPPKSTAAPRREITTDLIAVRAYILWENQGRPQGHDVANWLLAEKQLQQEQSFTA